MAANQHLMEACCAHGPDEDDKKDGKDGCCEACPDAGCDGCDCSDPKKNDTGCCMEGGCACGNGR